jgi:1L-myo-inositol 1-phosphate cytidylyltransferase / CDP-L-myo-inositol myo-inositolphosphotransferase
MQKAEGQPAPGPFVAAHPPRTAVVLAAGYSERLAPLTSGGSKLLLRLGGVTIIERTVRAVRRQGVERVVVVLGHDEAKMAEAARAAAPDRVEIVRAQGWESGNGSSLAAAEPAVSGEPLFLLLVGDHLYGDTALDPLVTVGCPAALLDPHPVPDVLGEATRVVVEDGTAVRFGKEVDSGWADCGAFLVPPAIFECQRQAATEGDHRLAAAISRLAEICPLRAVPLPEDAWWQDVDTPADVRRASVRLRRSLLKANDGPVSRHLNRPLSTRITMLVARTRLSPDVVTWLAFALGVVAAGLLALGQGLAGALVTHAASVLDGVDGELARLQMRASPRGALLDGFLDRLADVAIVAGLGLWGLTLGLNPSITIGLAVAASAGSVLSMATKDRIAALKLPRAPERGLGFLLGGRDGRLLLVTVLALLGQPVLALAAVAMASLVTAVLRVALVQRGLAKSGSRPTI